MTALSAARARMSRRLPRIAWRSTRAVRPCMLLAGEQELPDLLGLLEERPEPRQRRLHRLGKLVRTAEPDERLRRDELEEDVAAARRHADEVHGEHVVVLEHEHAEGRGGFE